MTTWRYDRLSEDLRAALLLKRIWTVASPEEDDSDIGSYARVPRVEDSHVPQKDAIRLANPLDSLPSLCRKNVTFSLPLPAMNFLKPLTGSK